MMVRLKSLLGALRFWMRVYVKHLKKRVARSVIFVWTQGKQGPSFEGPRGPQFDMGHAVGLPSEISNAGARYVWSERWDALSPILL
ncbi:hypothetical protein WG66_001675 [Moniliophthora roreri]|nr:hypothetical protein WG66_001675 [Moniliophthora roreri]